MNNRDTMKLRRAMAGAMAVGIIAFSAAGFSACGESAADKVSKNLGTAAEQFEVQRRIIFVNGITDKVLYSVEGRCSIETNDNLPANLEVICKEGPDSYKKHFLGLSDNVTWVSTQLEGVDVSEYRTRIIFRPESLVPNFDLIAGEQP